MDADLGNDVVTSLRSDLAALQYKRDKLLSEVSWYNKCIESTSRLCIFKTKNSFSFLEQRFKKPNVIS